MTQVLKGEANTLRLEPPGIEGKGIEFYVKRSSGTKYHQYHQAPEVLRHEISSGQAPEDQVGRWSLADLFTEGVLTHFYQRLDDPEATCIFVSAHAAHPLGELASGARDANSWEEFDSAFLSSSEWSGHFSDLQRRWGSPDGKDTYHRLSRIWVRSGDGALLRESIYSRLDLLVDGDPEKVPDALFRLALEPSVTGRQHGGQRGGVRQGRLF